MTVSRIHNLSVGKIGEDATVNFLKKKGYLIRQTHYTTHWGELDIIAEKDRKIIFVEVKTRISEHHGQPHEAIHYFKVNHLMRTIQHYLLKNRLTQYKLSLDAVSVVLDKDHNVVEIKHYENINT